MYKQELDCKRQLHWLTAVQHKELTNEDLLEFEVQRMDQ